MNNITQGVPLMLRRAKQPKRSWAEPLAQCVIAGIGMAALALLMVFL